jgi:hypothetical protein
VVGLRESTRHLPRLDHPGNLLSVWADVARRTRNWNLMVIALKLSLNALNAQLREVRLTNDEEGEVWGDLLWMLPNSIEANWILNYICSQKFP